MGYFKNRFLDEYGFKDPLQNLKTKRTLKYGGNKMKEENEEYEEVKSDIFKFEKEGDNISGELLSREKSFNYDNMVYKLKLDDGSVKVVFGTTVLDSIMQDIEIGSHVKIIFDSIKENNKKGQNDIKVFKVFRRKALI